LQIYTDKILTRKIRKFFEDKSKKLKVKSLAGIFACFLHTGSGLWCSM